MTSNDQLWGAGRGGKENFNFYHIHFRTILFIYLLQGCLNRLKKNQTVVSELEAIY